MLLKLWVDAMMEDSQEHNEQSVSISGAQSPSPRASWPPHLPGTSAWSHVCVGSVGSQ